MSLQPTSMMTPLTQQMSHLSLGSAGTVREHCMGSEMTTHYAYLRNHEFTHYVTVLPFYYFAVYGCELNYARSIYPTVCTHADNSCSCGGMF